MFSLAGLEALSRAHAATLGDLSKVEQALNRSLYGLNHAVRAIILAALSREPLLFIGPPGTAKSLLIRRFCRLIGLDPEAPRRAGAQGTASKQVDYFEYLLTAFTEPSELFGFFDLAKLQGGDGQRPVLERLDDGQMQHARVVFLDEVFNASSAILNAILTFMNERRFHDRGRIVPVPLEMLFAATNGVPRRGDLAALFDRFVLRAWIHHEDPTPAGMAGLLSTGWATTHVDPEPQPVARGLLDRLAAMHRDVDRAAGSLLVLRDQDTMANLALQVARVRGEQWSGFSPRRILRLARVMMLSMLYRATLGDGLRSREGMVLPGPEEYALIARYFLDVDPGEVMAEARLAKLVDDVRLEAGGAGGASGAGPGGGPGGGGGRGGGPAAGGLRSDQIWRDPQDRRR